MAKHHPAPRARRLFLLVSLTAMAVALLAPVTAAVAAPTTLTVTKTGNGVETGQVTPGQEITYSITIANGASATDPPLTLTDLTPVGTTYVASSATINGAPVAGATNPFADGELIPPIAANGSASASYRVTVNSPQNNGTQIVNTATATAPNAPNASDTTTHTVASAPKLTLAKTAAPAEGAVTPRTTIDYTMVVTNAADATEVADQLTLQDTTPTWTTYVEGSAKLNGNVIAGSGNPFASAFSLPDLAPAASHTAKFSVKVDSPLERGTAITNVGRLTGQNHANVQDTTTHTVSSAPVLKVTLSSSPKAGTKLEDGDALGYTIVVANDPAATESLHNILVQAPTPEGTSFIEGSAKLDGASVSRPARPLASTTVLAAPGPFPGGYALGTMSPGTSHTLTYRVRVKASANRITNTVTVSADNVTAAVTSISHRGPRSSSGSSGGSGSGSGGGSGSGSGSGGGSGSGSGSDGGDGSGSSSDGVDGTSTDDELALTGLDLVRLLVLVMAFLFMGWTLLVRGRVVQRVQARTVAGRIPAAPEKPNPWVASWFLTPQKK